MFGAETVSLQKPERKECPPVAGQKGSSAHVVREKGIIETP